MNNGDRSGQGFVLAFFKDFKPFIFNYLPQWTLLFGVLFLLLSCLLYGSSYEFIADVFSKLAVAALSGGIFAVLLKSDQFSRVFQEHVFTVMFRPERLKSMHQLRNSWFVITEAILRKVLPETHKNAASEIARSYLDAELAYHFENFVVTFDIRLLEDGRTMEVLQKTEADVVLSPGVNDPRLKQTGTVKEGGFELVSLVLDGSYQDLSQASFLSGEKDHITFELDLKKHCSRTNDNGDRYVHLERTYSIRQDYVLEPYFISRLSRYVRGMKVRARCNSGELLLTSWTTDESLRPFTEADGFTNWELAGRGSLMLPKQGYILFLQLQSGAAPQTPQPKPKEA